MNRCQNAPDFVAHLPVAIKLDADQKRYAGARLHMTMPAADIYQGETLVGQVWSIIGGGIEITILGEDGTRRYWSYGTQTLYEAARQADNAYLAHCQEGEGEHGGTGGVDGSGAARGTGPAAEPGEDQ